MILDRVTLTGADDSVQARDLAAIQLQYPFAEWGILFSGSRSGVARYPSDEWLEELAAVHKTRMHGAELKLSAHLCGRWVRDLVLNGAFSWWASRGPLVGIFGRIQLNFHAHHHPAGETFLDAIRGVHGKEFIFQMDEVNDRLWRSVHEQDIPAVPLFDTSGGAGILPDRWPHPYQGVYCGYAGGLGPDNLEGQLRSIAHMVRGDARVWIDMETKVRSDDDSVFDLDKCRQVLEIAAPFIGRRM